MLGNEVPKMSDKSKQIKKRNNQWNTWNDSGEESDEPREFGRNNKKFNEI